MDKPIKTTRKYKDRDTEITALCEKFGWDRLRACYWRRQHKLRGTDVWQHNEEPNLMLKDGKWVRAYEKDYEAYQKTPNYTG